MIKAGDRIEIKPEWQDAGDDEFVWIAVDDESKGRVTIQPQLELEFKPCQVVDVRMIQKVEAAAVK